MQVASAHEGRAGQRLGRRTIQVIQDVPAQDAVNGFRRLREPLGKEVGELFRVAVLDVQIDVLGNVFDAEAAAEVFTEERDIAAHDGAQVEQQGVVDPLQTGEKFLKRLRGVRRFGRARDGRFGRACRVGCPTRTQHAKEISQ